MITGNETAPGGEPEADKDQAFGGQVVTDPSRPVVAS